MLQGRINFVRSLIRPLMRMSTYAFLLILALIALLSRRHFFIINSPFGKLGNRLFLFANVVLSGTLIVAWVGASIAKSALSLNG